MESFPGTNESSLNASQSSCANVLKKTTTKKQVPPPFQAETLLAKTSRHLETNKDRSENARSHKQICSNHIYFFYKRSWHHRGILTRRYITPFAAPGTGFAQALGRSYREDEIVNVHLRRGSRRRRRRRWHRSNERRKGERGWENSLPLLPS